MPHIYLDRVTKNVFVYESEVAQGPAITKAIKDTLQGGGVSFTDAPMQGKDQGLPALVISTIEGWDDVLIVFTDVQDVERHLTVE